MSAVADAIVTLAMTLPEDERRDVGRRLLDEDTAPGEETPSAEWQESWRPEIERRLASLRDGTARTHDGETVMREARERLAARRAASR